MTTSFTDPKLTDERLRSWLDANQLGRERMCQAILSIDKRFRSVEPRHPRGGPDGGRDLQAHFEDGRIVYAAVGFVNSASDSSLDKRQIEKKFKDDLISAKCALPDLKVFIFFTNVSLTVGEKDDLIKNAKSSGIELCEIFDRERARISLDSPDGLSIRYQYLQIPLSEAEQAAFFARWGNDLQTVITQSFHAVDERLRRIEFNQEQARPLRHFGFSFKLNPPLTPDTKHFRALLSVAAPTPRSSYQHLYVGICDDNDRYDANRKSSIPGLAGAFWADEPKNLLQKSSSMRPNPIQTISAHGGFSEWADQFPYACLSELDENFFAFFLNRSLADRTERIWIQGNEYLLWTASFNEVHVDSNKHIPEWPWKFTDEELADPWVRIMPKTGTGIFDFSHYTPRRLWDSTLVEK